MDGRHHRLAAVAVQPLQASEEGVSGPDGLVGGLLGQLGEPPDVGAGEEVVRLARDEDGGLDGGVLLQPLQDADEVLHQGRVQGVEGVAAAVHGDGGEAVGDVEAEVVVRGGHRAAPGVRGGISARGSRWHPAHRRRIGTRERCRCPAGRARVPW